MLRALCPQVDGVVLTCARQGMTFDLKGLMDRHIAPSQTVYEPDLERAVMLARKLAGPSGGVVVTGSLYLVGDTLRILDATTGVH